MGPEQMMMYYLMQNGMWGGSPAAAKPAQEPASNMPLLQMFGGAGVRSPLGGPWDAVSPPTKNAQAIAPMMQKAMQPEKPGWMGQFGQFLDGIDPNLRLMMGMGGLSNLGRILGGGA